ncbi:uncharacterized protein LOC115984080 isoform X2 [Quercus lobata]|uniref:uncharacterized protein LOC115984080 isoform X2 n=1 Tax=Quercus lobata TaxID=97700 RepID=UPI001248F43F|nr:uncharacterized protein LOC115984080 isoform X2 [Quercus lobata]
MDSDFIERLTGDLTAEEDEVIMDFIERLTEDLTAEEDEVIMVRSEHREKTLEEWSLSLLGRFHTTELINFRAAENHLRSAWKMEGNDLTITDVGDGLFRFKFSMECQLKWVINNGPWSFDNHILLLRRWEKGMTVFSVNFQTVPMWVQVWGLPFDLINKEAGIDIGQRIGRVIEVDCKAIASGEARFLRVRVDVPLDKPIRGGAPVLSPEGDKVWVAFKYERLSGLCFHCGLLSHEAKACKFTKLKVWEESPYGEWLRATEDVPPQTSDSLVLAQSHRDGNPNNNNEDTREEALFFLESHNFHLDSAVSTFLDSLVAQSHRDGNGHGIDGVEMEPLQNFNWDHGHSYHSRTTVPEIVEVVECTELKGPDINEEQYWESNDGKNPELNAIPALQNYMLGKSSSGSELKCLEQKLDCFDPKLLLSQGLRRLCDAFRLLLTDPDVKRLVVSLASDKAVRDVILRNTSLREFQWTPYAVNYVRPLISNEEPGSEEPGFFTRILMWIWDRIKSKFGKFLSLVNELFQPPKSNNPTEGNKEKMEEKYSLALSVVIFLIVVVARALTA